MDEKGNSVSGILSSDAGCFFYVTLKQFCGNHYFRVKAQSPGLVDSAAVAGASPCAVSGLVADAPNFLQNDTVNYPDGTFWVWWQSSTSPTPGYVLEMATVDTFADATIIYTGSANSYRVTGTVNGNHYFRVTAQSPGLVDSAAVAGASPCVVSGLP